MSGRVGSCRHRVGTMSELVGMWRAFAMSMSKRDVIKKLMSSGLGHEKMGIWPQTHYFREVFWVKFPLFYLQRPFIFSGEMSHPITNPLRKKWVPLLKIWAFDPKNTKRFLG